MQHVKKTIGENNIPESTTVVVVKALPRSTAVCEREAKQKEKCDPHARRERWTQAVGNNNSYI